MRIAANVMVGIVAALHVYFLMLEMFLWTTPYGRKTFGLTEEFAAASKTLALNQGLYNGFLAAGLLWGLMGGGRRVTVFFLACVVIAGIVGGFSANPKIFVVQALPGVVALALVLLASR